MTHMHIVATPATRAIAERIIRETADDGAEATMRHLPDVNPAQVPALVALIARAAAATGLAAGDLAMSRKAQKEAHNRYNAGQRDAVTRHGELAYQQARRAHPDYQPRSRKKATA